MPDDERPGPMRPSGPPLGGDREITYQDEPGWWRRHLSGVIAIVVTVVVVAVIAIAVLATRNLGDVAESDATASASSSAAPASSAAVTPTPTVPATVAPPVISTAKGAVQAVAGPQWTLAVQKDLTLTIVIEPGTNFPRGKSIADVVVGSQVTVTGALLNGVITAQKVTIDK